MKCNTLDPISLFPIDDCESFSVRSLACILTVLAHLSWKLRWAYLIACCPSCVCQFVKFFIQIQPNKALFGKEIQVCSNEGLLSFPRGVISENSLGVFFKSYFQKPLDLFQSKLAQSIWVKRIQLYSNEGSCPFSRGDDNKN